MLYFRNIWFALAAFLWLPAAAHCQLESLTGLPFLQCHEKAPAAHASSEDCANCCAVEKSQFPAAQHRLSAPQPEMLLMLSTLLAPHDAARPPSGKPLDFASARPELTCRWSFLRRAAPPVRAPSPAS